MPHSRLILLPALMLCVGTVQAQDSLDVTFRFLHENQARTERAFVPGSFNG